MPFIDPPASRWRSALCRAVALLSLGLVACSPPRPPVSPSAPVGDIGVLRPPAAAPLPPTVVRRARNWDEFAVLAGHRLVLANPEGTYMGVVPEPLLAIPVLEVELNGDGSVRRIDVVRRPTQALDTVQLAIDAVRRAAPFGDVSHLPRPWRFTEVFLFDDNRRFKPRALDQ